jgi:MFS family permease
VSFSVAGLFWGNLVNKLNRKNLISLACIVWSLTSLATGWFNSFGILVLMRIILGSAMAATDPFAFSMINDMFKPSQKGMANTVWTAAPFVGGGMSAFSVVAI